MNNSFFVSGDLVYIKIVSPKTQRIYWTIIDLENLDKVSKASYWWRILAAKNGKVYVKSVNFGDNNKSIILHRFLVGLENNDSREPDHINNNGLDNRLDNLRIVTRSINSFNKELRADNTTGTTGVYWRKDVNRWEVKVGKKRIGYYSSKDAAIKARLSVSSKYTLDESML